MPNTIAFYTLGCKLNFSETSTIGRQMTDAGFEKVNFTDGADVYVINTCSVTDHADRKCKKVVKEALKKNAKAFIVIVGCYAQLKPQEISQIPGVDMVLGAAEKFNLPEHLQSLIKTEKAVVKNAPIKEVNTFVPGFSLGDRTRMFMKLQDGCDYFCTFCTIPLARGKSRSLTVANTIEKVREATINGVKEVILTGVNLGDFGVNHGETFFDLIKELDQLEEITRYRISSIEPNLLSNEIIEFVAASRKFVPHFHIPLQSADDEILGKMRRKYLSELYKNRVEHIKEIMPNCSIGVDVIVGFPGETDEKFLTTYNFLNELDISYLHVFPYSERANTGAVKIPGRVQQRVRNERVTQLISLSEKKKRRFYEQYIGEKYMVLFEEENRNGFMYGFTPNYIKVQMGYDPLLVDQLTEVRLAHINTEGMMHGLIEEYA
jgi:threonylcarbamoyladenosine tRNA methylthiotransferase MtaB